MAGSLVVILCFAFVVGLGTTPLARRLALRLRVLDHPDGRRFHTRSVPLLGGIAIYAAVIVPLLVVGERGEVVKLAAITLAASLVALSGLWDDRKSLGIRRKIAIQSVAALVLFFGGVRVHLPGPEAVDLLLTMVWILVVTNAFNLIDNLDGLCSGVAAVAAGFFLLLAVLNGEYIVGALAAALCGACSAFLLFNTSPARIFMGDAGSLFIGFLMAVLGIELRFPDNVVWVTWMVPVLVLGVPLFDVVLVTVSRWRRGLNPATTPGTDHTSHRLTRLRFTRRGSVATLYLVTVLLGSVATAVSFATPPTAYAAAAAVAATASFSLFWLERPGLSGETRRR